jgi:hypothetical protein
VSDPAVVDINVRKAARLRVATTRLESIIDHLNGLVGMTETLLVIDAAKLRFVAEHPREARQNGWIV